jgi:hypothetical protein
MELLSGGGAYMDDPYVGGQVDDGVGGAGAGDGEGWRLKYPEDE